jgi:hypothetical protein
MKALYHPAEFRSFWRALQIVGVALALAGPSRLWGQCQQGIASFTLDKGSVVALAAGSAGTATGTVTLNCPSLYVPTWVYISVSPPNGALVTCPRFLYQS